MRFMVNSTRARTRAAYQLWNGGFILLNNKVRFVISVPSSLRSCMGKRQLQQESLARLLQTQVPILHHPELVICKPQKIILAAWQLRVSLRHPAPQKYTPFRLLLP